MLTPIVKRKILIKEIFGFKTQKLCFSEVFILWIIFILIFPMFGVPRPRESGDLWGKNSCFSLFYAWFLFSRDENGSYCRTIFSICPFFRVVLIFAGTKWFIFSRPHQNRENMNTRSLETRKWGPREKMDVYSNTLNLDYKGTLSFNNIYFLPHLSYFVYGNKRRLSACVRLPAPNY